MSCNFSLVWIRNLLHSIMWSEKSVSRKRMKLILPSSSLLSFTIAPELQYFAVLQHSHEQKDLFPLPSHFISAPIQDAESCIQHLKTPGMTNAVIRICRAFICCRTSVPHSFMWNLQRPPFHHEKKEKKFEML